jgi:predicted solute-binding protein
MNTIMINNPPTTDTAMIQGSTHSTIISVTAGIKDILEKDSLTLPFNISGYSEVLSTLAYTVMLS